MEWFKVLKQRFYISRINKKEGSKGIQRLINLSMKQLKDNQDNTLDDKELEQISKLLSESLTN